MRSAQTICLPLTPVHNSQHLPLSVVSVVFLIMTRKQMIMGNLPRYYHFSKQSILVFRIFAVQHPCWFRLSIGMFLGLSLSLPSHLILAGPSQAEVIPNGLNTRVEDQDCASSCTVTGGSIRGTNVFHSFEELSIPRNGVATFVHDEAITNIITRVTGGSPSRINGTLETLLNGSTNDVGTADFFLINPNGIVFGANAQLNIGGSFIGSTAEYLTFEDDTEFSVNDANPLLTISTPTGLQFGTDPGRISTRGLGHNLSLNLDETVNRGDRPAGLEVLSGHTLALVGSDLNLNGGNLTAEAGRIELGAVGDNSGVTLTEKKAGWRINYSNVETFGDIQLSNAASADVSGDNAGILNLHGGTIRLQDGSSLLANTLVNGGGSIILNASESIFMSGISSTSLAEELKPIPTSAYIEISPGATGDGSNELRVTTSDLFLEDGAQIGISMGGLGLSGSVTINADQIIADRDVPTAFSGLFAAVLPIFPGDTDSFPPSLGTGGDLVINTNSLQISNGAQILVSTFGIGDAGTLTINAQDIEVFGFSDFGPSSLQATSEFPPTGRGGQITINTERLSVRNGGQIATSTASLAQSAGNITIRATDSVELQGTTPVGRSGLFATAVSLRNPETGAISEAAGEGGSIVVETPALIVRDGATINVGNNPSNPDIPFLAPGNGSAGNLTVNADLIQLDHQAVVTANTVDGDRANINLNSDLIVLRDRSQITTNATGRATGGNLTLDTRTLAAFNNSDITANAVESRGGNVQIRAQSVLGIQPREALTPLSDITASSRFGLEGTIAIEAPDAEPEQGLIELSSEVVDVTRLITQTCRQNARSTYSQFRVRGRGGVPSHPGRLLNRRAILASPTLPIQEIESANTNITASSPTATRSDSRAVSSTVTPLAEPFSPITEARGWSVNRHGQLTLSADVQATSVHAYVPRQSRSQCYGL